MSEKILVRFQNLSCGYPTPRLIDLNIDFDATGVVVLLGANGSGKTSFLECLSGLLPPESGALAHNHTVAYTAHESFFYRPLTLRENLEFFAQLQGVSEASLYREIEFFQLHALLESSVSELSQGQRARATIARSFMDDGASVLCFDEPTSALDDHFVDRFLDRVTEHRGKKLLFIATHDVARLNERLSDCTDVLLVLHCGRLAYRVSRAEDEAAWDDAIQRYRELNR